jgi:hypothetical protein
VEPRLIYSIHVFYDFDHVTLSINVFTCLFWCSSCTSHPQTSQVPMHMMHMFRGRMYYNSGADRPVIEKPEKPEGDGFSKIHF